MQVASEDIAVGTLAGTPNPRVQHFAGMLAGTEPERQTDHDAIRRWLPPQFRDARVLEVV